MPDIVLVRQDQAKPEQSDLDAARRVLFGGFVDGLGEFGKKQWRRFWNGMLRLEPGEMATITTHRERLGWFHRKHMKLESRIFEEQERFEDFEQFRNWLKIGAGHCDWAPGPKGGVVPIPRSIAYSRIDQQEMESFHDAAVRFLRTPHAAKALWPKLPESQRDDAIEAILSGEFSE